MNKSVIDDAVLMCHCDTSTISLSLTAWCRVCEENQDNELKFSHYDFRASEAQVPFKGLTTLTNE